MEAEDTVMMPEKVTEITEEIETLQGDYPIFPHRALAWQVAKAQAEISFKAGRGDGVQAVIGYLKNEIVTQDKRTLGKPKLKAHLNAVERIVLQTVINALEEWQDK